MDTVPVSVVIPAYRAAHTIRRSLDSVLQQSTPPTEILVIDDGSPDGEELSSAILQYGSAVTLLRKTNGGAASARNFGIEHAKHDWIAFLDADDYWEIDKLERQMKVIYNNPGIGVVGCRWYEEEPSQVRTPSSHQALRFAGRRLQTRGSDAFEVALVVWTSSLLIRRSALAAERFDTDLVTAEDRDLWIRLFANNDAYILPELLATYVQEPGGLSRSDIDCDCECMLKVINRYADLLGPAGLRAQIALVHKRWASEHLFQGRSAKAFPHALQRLWLQPFSIQAWWIVVKAATGACLQKKPCVVSALSI